MIPVSIQKLARYWFDELGCTECDVHTGQTQVFAHGTLKGYGGVYVFRRLGGCVISAPTDFVSSLQTEFTSLSPDQLFKDGVIGKALGSRLDRVIGPAWIGGLNPQDFKPCHGPETRLLDEDDWELLGALLDDCEEHGGPDSALAIGRSPTVGVFVDGQLAAAAGYGLLAGSVAHIGVLTSPRFRGQGLGRKAVSLITETALAAGLGIQYQTLTANVASIRVAESLGFHAFAETLAARIRLAAT